MEVDTCTSTGTYRPQGRATSTLLTVKLALGAVKLDEDWPCPSLTTLMKNRRERASSALSLISQTYSKGLC